MFRTVLKCASALAILLLAPILGQVADRKGRKKRWLLIATALLAVLQFGLFFVFADPSFFWIGAILVSLGAVASEIAGVNYNALLVSVSTPRTVGKVFESVRETSYRAVIVPAVDFTALDLVGVVVPSGTGGRVIEVDGSVPR